MIQTALPFLLMGVSAGKSLYGLNRSRKAQHEAESEIDMAIGSIEPTMQGLDTRASLINQGAQIDQDMLDLQMKQSRLASRQRSLSNIENLKEVLSSQRAMFAARGQAIGQGVSAIATQKSLSNFGREEQARRLNQKYGELQIKGHKALTEINRGYGIEQIGHEKEQLRDRQRLLGMKKQMLRKEGRRSRRDTLFGSALNLTNTFMPTFGSLD